MTWKHVWNTGVLALAVLLPLAACSDDDAAGVDGAGEMTVLLTDAPADIEAAVVTISEIFLTGEGVEGEADGRVVLRSTPVTTDLLTLQNDVEALVEEESVPAGSYGQLRFVIDGAAMLVDTDGDETTDDDKVVLATSADFAGLAKLPEGFRDRDAELKCPSCSQSGFKVILPGSLQIEEGEEIQLLVDFDVSQSFVRPAGASGKWILRPTLKATSVNATSSVRITLNRSNITLPIIGTDTITLTDFDVKLTNAAGTSSETLDLVATNDANVAGVTFLFLDPTAGPFKVELVGPAGLTFTTTPAGAQTANVTAGATTTLNFQLATAVASGG